MCEGLRWLADYGFIVNTVLYVGAFNGSWSAEYMVYYPDATYVLFEPQPVHSAALDDFAAECKRNVCLVKKAVGASEGYTFFDAADPFGGALSDKEGESLIKVGLTTVDAALLEINSAAPYLLKLDTHGFEKSILAGSTTLLKNVRC